MEFLKIASLKSFFILDRSGKSFLILLSVRDVTNLAGKHLPTGKHFPYGKCLLTDIQIYNTSHLGKLPQRENLHFGAS